MLDFNMPLIVHGHLRPNHKMEIVLQIPVPDWLTVELVTKDEQRRKKEEKKRKKKGNTDRGGKKCKRKEHVFLLRVLNQIRFPRLPSQTTDYVTKEGE